ncbi:hypothetical protein SEA_MOAB_149 [Streptomyces phage Moab]|nr:hypothetical protein SEA_MOAB_149 [Streptomyces phage Moab]
MIVLAILGGILLTWFLAGVFVAGYWSALAACDLSSRMIGWVMMAGSIGVWYISIGIHINWGNLFV